MAMIRYLTGCTNKGVEAVAFERGVGLLIQPGNSYHQRVAGGFNADKFRRMLARPELQAAADRCLFVVAPDKLVILDDGTIVGDAAGTLDQFPAWAGEIRAAGFPVALVAQDGLETMLDAVPWALVDVLFLGGSTEWKLGTGARACVDAARARGKRTHMGRVNSYRRLAIAQAWGVDTADGTFLGFAPKPTYRACCAGSMSSGRTLPSSLSQVEEDPCSRSNSSNRESWSASTRATRAGRA